MRALRRRRRWRQADLGAAARCSQQTVSEIERGRLTGVSLEVLGRVVVALDATLVIDVRWRAGAIERLLDEGHAALVSNVASRLTAIGWTVQVEVTYSEYGERGSFDLLAFRDGTVLVVETKTDLVSAEATLRKLDEKARLARKVGRDRFGWDGRRVGRLLVLPGMSTARRRIERHAALFDRALPSRGSEVRHWLARPLDGAAGIWFVSDTRTNGAIHAGHGLERVRPRKPGSSTNMTGR